MSDERETWRRVCAVGDAFEQALLAEGVDKEFAANIAEVIRHKAGSYLPPVGGVFDAQFSDATVKT